MKAPFSTPLLRRDLLRGAIAGVAVTATGAVAIEPAAAQSRLGMDKRKARYNANSTEVQEFYRVNAYPPKK
ncbi:formate dehydrogenase [Starkeya sp. ORNL1]|uniref:formate dehydrogenase n=1 Tax=Starkeya sp. ORNL1 TaxID=2709380 RepID=UPI0014635D57|nr:formate dehydrogenase [Starkeya sp. ORNL1]QJP16840.1 formate dehydrogenase [Starkeya sp. ORNL1]